MKKIVLITILVFILICIAPVSAVNLKLSFQDLDDYSHIQTIGIAWGATATPIIASAGGNNYIYLAGDDLCHGIPTIYVAPIDPGSSLTMASGTIIDSWNGLGTHGGQIGFFDGTKTLMGAVNVGKGDHTRILAKMIGNTAYLYANGTLVGNSTPFTQNPSYIGFGINPGPEGGCWYRNNVYWDNIIWGDEAETGYVFGQPTTDYYILKKDMLNPATSGFYFENGTLISSFLMPASYSKNSDTPETITLANYGTGATYASRSTGVNWSQTFFWDVNTAMFSSSAPFGFYATTISGKGYSNIIAYIGSGATVDWDKSIYSTNDVATISYNITAAYFLPVTYTYTGKIVDIYGTEHASNPILTPIGSFIATLDSTDYDPGYYFAEVVATPIAGGSNIVMNYDMMEIVNYLTISGYVRDAEIPYPLANTNITITQSSIISRLTSGYDGNYTTVGISFYPNYALWLNSSAINFDNDNHSWIPLIAKTYNVNISMVRNNPYPVSNVTIGGIIYEMPYYTPMANANGVVINTSHGSCIATTNLAGFYRCGNLEVNKYYDVWGWVAGYVNSTVYSIFATGV